MRQAISVLAVTFLIVIGSARADDPHVIVQDGRAFRPSEVNIKRGEALTFSNRDQFIHQIFVAVSPPLFDSDEQAPGQDIKVTFPTSGTFEVHCHIHPKMLLIVHVK